jgi:hypothetical protein
VEDGPVTKLDGVINQHLQHQFVTVEEGAFDGEMVVIDDPQAYGIPLDGDTVEIVQADGKISHGHVVITTAATTEESS